MCRGFLAAVNGKERIHFRKTAPFQDENVFTLFVDNINPRLVNRDLRSVFQKIGRVEDVFISRKKRSHTDCCFGFIRFGEHRLALEAIRRMDGRPIEGENIIVKWPRFKRQHRSVDCRGSRMVHKDSDLRTVDGFICEEARSWLERSLILETKCPLDVVEVSTWMARQLINVEKVRDMGRFKFLATFESQEAMQRIMEHFEKNMESKCFTIRKWSEEEVCQRRYVWVEIYGIPPIAWCRRNFDKAVESIGTLDWFEEDLSMGSAKVLIQTALMSFIKDHFFMRIGEAFHEVFIRELEHPVKSVPSFFCVYQGDVEHASIRNPVDAMEEEANGATGENVNHGADAIIEQYEEPSGEVTPLSLSRAKPTHDGMSFSAMDDAMHLPTRDDSHSLVCERHADFTWEVVEAEEASFITNTANVSYNLDQEVELIKQWADTLGGPPGFPLSGHLDLNNQAQHEESISAVQSSSRKERIKPKRSGKLGKKNNSRKASQKRSFPSANGVGDLSSTDDEDLDDQEEAKKTWQVGKALNLFAEQEDEIIQNIFKLRRSSRKKNLSKAASKAF